MGCRQGPWALKAKRDGKEARSVAVAGLPVEGAQASWRMARRLLYRQ